MNLNSNLIARLMINDLPGLAGALQPLSGGTQILSELARRQDRQKVANAMLAGTPGLLAPVPIAIRWGRCKGSERVWVRR